MKKKNLTPQQIVEAEILSRGEGNDWKTAYVMMLELIKKPDWRLFRAEDTLFLMNNHRNKEQSVEFYIYNGDTPEDFKGNFQDFLKALKVSGFKYAIFEPVGQHTAESLRRIHHKATEHDGVVHIEL